MKRILGLDLGTTSIGWALVNEKENDDERSSIVRLGVRVVPLSTDEISNFDKGKAITTNADRTLKRSMRRNLQRYKLRRHALTSILKEVGWIDDKAILAEHGNFTTFETLRLRAKAATEEVTLEELARILLNINKKRGYKSNRREKRDDSKGQLIDGMEVAMILSNEDITPGEYSLRMKRDGYRRTPDYYPSDLNDEFNRIWRQQAKYYTSILTDELKDSLIGKNSKQTWAILKDPFNLQGLKRDTKGLEAELEECQWRVEALKNKIEPEKLAIVLQNINQQISKASGYLGRISDHSKELAMGNKTVGQWQMEQLDKDPHFSLKNQVFYRQDYLNEFETIWNTQSRFHPEMTDELRHDIRDITIFYQRPLKSKKGMLDVCQLERRTLTITRDGKEKTVTAGPKVCPKSSPLFQEFKIWQRLNDVRVMDSEGNSELLDEASKQKLVKELSIREKMTAKEALSMLYKGHRRLSMNFKELEGNRTMAKIYETCTDIADDSGHSMPELGKVGAETAISNMCELLGQVGVNPQILRFDSSLPPSEFERQPAYQLWHLLYSYIDDSSNTGDEGLLKVLHERFGFDESAAHRMANITFDEDYGALSTKAMRKILPYMKDGEDYAHACVLAGYNHSERSLTKEQKEERTYCDTLNLLPRNSLRNPVVEKILNQMVNVINSIAAEYGKPDEVRIELARELKKSAKERKETTDSINKLTSENAGVAKILQAEPFNIARPSRNDIIRYRLWKELEKNGYHTLYSDTYVPADELFSRKFDIEHIIPQARLFDDSFSNKTIEARQVNIDKSDATAYDYILATKGEDGAEAYRNKINDLQKKGCFSMTKCRHLLWREADIPDDFIERDLRNSQYIAKKALEMLEGYVPSVVATSGSITDRLREDWGLIDIMKEINWEKYNTLGLTETYTDKEGNRRTAIKDWTKRNDHRHHAMDALTVAFTKRSIVQYLNHLNARSDRNGVTYGIEKKELHRNSDNHLVFNPPIPIDEFRTAAKQQLEQILVSQKAKNKVVTRNLNVTKKKGGRCEKMQLTPRGQLHKETIYGRRQRYVTKEERVGTAFSESKILTIANKTIREAMLKRLMEYGGNPKKAFGGTNAIAKKPIWLNEHHTSKVPGRVKTVSMETYYTIREVVNPDLKIDKVIDVQIRRILEQRLKDYGDDPKKAFSNLEEDPIYLNKEKGIVIKRVEIDTGITDPVPLHEKHDLQGTPIGGPADFVQTGNNHHIAIFLDADGNLQEHVVSFFEATQRALQHIPITDREYNRHLGWQFLFSMKRNEYFVFPNPKQGFDPNEVDLLDPKNYASISQNLYRVQKLSSKDYYFRHHLETNVETPNELRNTTWKRITSISGLAGIVKVRINHTGRIVASGEY